MCGIIGKIAENININKFIQMRDKLIHRGPDDQGFYLNESKNVALGHRRLAIIDLTHLGKQPMSNEDGTIWITFNGEIYNFQEIKEELIALNHIFKSKTDTEVILHGYEEWGKNILHKLRGMFAFGIWDDSSKNLFLARDRVGIKPLYYYTSEEKFIFASEIKAIVEDDEVKREINPIALRYYFKNGYIPSPHSIWKNLHKLPPGHYLEKKDEKIIIKQYWDLPLKNRKLPENLILDQIEILLLESVKLRHISDVPVGTLLSGGIDSSLVTALSRDIGKDFSSFSIGFDEDEYDELKYVDILVNELKIKNIQKRLSHRNADRYFDKILYHYDEPFAISSIFPTFLLMESIHKKLKVVLSGDGGDEIFTGYAWYARYESNRKFLPLVPYFKIIYYLFSIGKRLLPKRIANYLDYYLKLYSSENLMRYRLIHGYYFEADELKKILTKPFFRNEKEDKLEHNLVRNGFSNVKDLQYFDFKTFLVDHILVKVDRASMAYSIEVRVPYLDHKLIEYVMNLDSKILFKEKKLKYLLKSIAKKHLPPAIINRKKKGFSAPVGKLGFIQKNIHFLENSITVQDGILKEDYIKKILKTPINKLESKMWFIILFEMWYRKWKK